MALQFQEILKAKQEESKRKSEELVAKRRAEETKAVKDREEKKLVSPRAHFDSHPLYRSLIAKPQPVWGIQS